MSTPEERSESEPNEVNFRVILPNGGIRDFSIPNNKNFSDIIKLVKESSPEHDLNNLIITTPGPEKVHGETIDNTTPLRMGEGILELPLLRLSNNRRENYKIKEYLKKKDPSFIRKFKDDNDEDRYLLRSAIKEIHGSKKSKKSKKHKKHKKPKSKGVKRRKTKRSRI